MMKPLIDTISTWPTLVIWIVAILTIVYAIYTLVRAYAYFENGVKQTWLGYRPDAIRFYHILWFVVDLPSVAMGRFYHVLKWFFSFKIYTFKEDEKQ